MLGCAEWIPSVELPIGNVLHLSVTGKVGVDPEVAGHLSGAGGEILPPWHFEKMRRWCAV